MLRWQNSYGLSMTNAIIQRIVDSRSRSTESESSGPSPRI